MTSLLDIAAYTVDYQVDGKLRRVLDGIDLSVRVGEVVGLVGESGSGKSTLAWAITRHLPSNAREGGGTIHFAGTNLRTLGRRQVMAFRGRRIGMVFQDPATALNPTLTLGRQVTEVLELHRGLSPRAARSAAIDALNHVGLHEPEALLKRYPHEISGGEKQRIVIATAFASRPELIIFDEPTTALDVITGARLLDLFRQLRAETGVAALYISHDLGLVSQIADRVAVLRSGKIVEQGNAANIFHSPRQDYTRRLIAALPRPERRLIQEAPGKEGVLQVENLGVTYGRQRLFRRTVTTGNRGINFTLHRGEILGVVGESGSGKSSLARALLGLAKFSGSIRAGKQQVMDARQMMPAYRNGIQLVFQHPDTSLNPRQRVRDILARPLRLAGRPASEVMALLEMVQLTSAYADRYPHELSGGEKQRVAIARAFAPKPNVVVCDEITASLDVLVQQSVIELLLSLRAVTGTAFLFITHDLNLVRQIAHRLMVMRRGEVVDLLPVQALTSGAEDEVLHPYTRELIAATPTPIG